MPELQVSVVLPYYLRLAAGEYQTAQAGETVQIVAPLLQVHRGENATEDEAAQAIAVARQIVQIMREV